MRTRYDSLLGDLWNIDIQELITTNVNRTKMSGLLVMAGLWPPKGSNVWLDELAWQPIPYNYDASSPWVSINFFLKTFSYNFTVHSSWMV